MAGDLSTGTTIIANLTIGGGGFGFGGFGGAIGGGNSNATQYGQLDLRTNRAAFSMHTFTAFSGMTTGNVRFVLQSSGMSILISSGKSVYDIGSATSAAQT
jgi:hypothetical protein